MPTYDYQCGTCGPFRDNYPMAAFADPQACPNCEALSPRALAIPSFGGGAEDNSAATAFPASHSGGCACCAAPRRLTAEAV